MKKVFQLFLGLITAGVGLLIAGIALVGILEPVGSKMSDDSNPFGDPSISVPYTISLVVVSLGFLILSLCLLNGLDKK